VKYYLCFCNLLLYLLVSFTFPVFPFLLASSIFLLFHSSHSTRIVLLRFQAGCHSRRLNLVFWCWFFRSTPASRPNKVGLKCLPARPPTKSFFHFSEIWYVGRGRWVMHDGMQNDPIQGQGHEPLKVGNSARLYPLPFIMGAGKWPWILKLGHNT